MIEIACAADDSYVPHCGAMLHSLLANNPSEVFRIHFLHDQAFAKSNQDRLIRLAEKFGAKVNLVTISHDLIGKFPSKKFHISCWYRVLLPALLPDVAKVLYLDADMVILDDIGPLWKTDLGGNIMGAVVNPLYPFMPDRATEQLGLRDRHEYLNSGVLLMDLGLMRSESVSEKVLEYARSNPENIWPEQDALSVVCQGRWLSLHPRWNAQTTLYDLDSAQLPFPAAITEEARKNPAIVHFIGPLKPWHYLCRHPIRAKYDLHRRQSPWPNYELEGRTFFNYLIRPLSIGNQIAVKNMLSKIFKLPRRIVRKITGRSRPWKQRVIARFSFHYPNATFVQIGSNDGKKHDPIHASLMQYQWSGVMVEPVKYVFDRLHANYKNIERIKLENVAVAKESGQMPFYHLAKASEADSGKLPAWYDELGSFNKDVVFRHIGQIPDLEDRLLCTSVPCVTFTDLCRRNNIEALDLIHMDTEGYDFEIIKTIDFVQFRPILLMYEHRHLSGSDRLECKQRMLDLGYELLEDDADTWCVDARVRSERHKAFYSDWTGIARES